MESLDHDRISRVAVDESCDAIGWIGGIPAYSGNVWEVHPLVVASPHRGETSLSDLYAEFYLRAGFKIVGVLPDADGPGAGYLSRKTSHANECSLA